VNKKLEPHLAGRAAPLDRVKQSVHSDLQYVSLQMDGKTYGGWYRQLADGRLELTDVSLPPKADFNSLSSSAQPNAQ
jgi:hypothetical protein